MSVCSRKKKKKLRVLTTAAHHRSCLIIIFLSNHIMPRMPASEMPTRKANHPACPLSPYFGCDKIGTAFLCLLLPRRRRRLAVEGGTKAGFTKVQLQEKADLGKNRCASAFWASSSCIPFGECLSLSPPNEDTAVIIMLGGGGGGGGGGGAIVSKSVRPAI